MVRPMGAGKLSDDEIGRRLREASDVLGVEPGETVAGDTALRAARIALVALQTGLEEAVEPSPRPGE